MTHDASSYDGRDPVLGDCGVQHSFGSRAPEFEVPGAPRSEEVRFPKQVHGSTIVRARDDIPSLGEADAVISDTPGRWIGIVTADCLPILIASEDGGAVAAIHAGWRGLADGVVRTGALALRALAMEARPARALRFFAAIGPHAGSCCYEVDGPVLEALAQRFGEEALASRLAPTRSGHARVDLASLAVLDLEGAGLAADRIGRAAALCSIGCEAFHSYRRDGSAAGRMVHAIAAG